MSENEVEHWKQTGFIMSLKQTDLYPAVHFYEIN